MMTSEDSTTISTTSGDSLVRGKPKLNRTGTVVLDVNGQPQIVKLHLTEESLSLYREEFAYSHSTIEKMDSSIMNKERVVIIRRERVGGLGLSIKGGSEHHLPVLVSKIFKDQAADRTGQLFVGDAILKVNDLNIERYSHDDAVALLKAAGEEVSLVVKFFRPASVFLASHAHRSSSQSASDFENGNVPGSPTSLSDDVFQPEQHWTEILTLPLLCAYITRYLPDTDEVRQETFEVFSMDGQTSGAIQCEDTHSALNWINTISRNINNLNAQSILLTNKTLQANQQVYHMCWVCERVTKTKLVRQNWKRVFLAFKGSHVCIFDAPPVKTKDWVKCESMNTIYECMFRLVKRDELEDRRDQCFVVETGHGDVHYFSVENKADLYKIQTAWFNCNLHTILQLQTKTYSCKWNGRVAGLTIDLQDGISLYDSTQKQYEWSYRFSQLKSSSDDGHSKLTLHFFSQPTNNTELRDIECANLKTVLCAMQSFLCAKLMTVDPTYLSH